MKDRRGVSDQSYHPLEWVERFYRQRAKRFGLKPVRERSRNDGPLRKSK
jgi:hypothetical protein